MKRPEDIDDLVVAGAVGGFVAGAVVAIWFLGVDLLAGQPFRTPAVLGYILMRLPEPNASVPLVGAYTILHFGMFMFLGVATAWFLTRFDVTPGLLVGLLFGLFVLHLVYYGALLVTGANLLGVLPWYHVLPANLLAGMGLMTYLHHATREERPLGLGVLRGHPLLTQGIVTGLIGAAVVAAWFFILDVAAGRPFYTPGALGSALFLGAHGEAEIRTSLGVVAGYTVVHLAAFIVAGIVFVAVAEYIERAPPRLLLVGLAFIVLEAVTVLVLSVGAAWALGSLGSWAVAVANLLAVAAMGWRVWRTHPTLRERLRRAPLQVDI